MVDIRAEENATEWAHQKAGAECHESKHQLRELASGREEGLADRARVVAKNKKVVHLQEVSAGYAHDRPDLSLSCGTAERYHVVFSSPVGLSPDCWRSG